MTPLQQVAASVTEEVRKCVEKLSQNYPELNLCIALLGEAELSQARLSEDHLKKRGTIIRSKFQVPFHLCWGSTYSDFFKPSK
jgi:hypothetical protein